MAIQLDEKVKAIIQAPDTKKVLATVDKKGEVHVVFKGSLTVDGDGNLVVLELLETSENNRNLTYSLWFDKKVAVNVLAADGTSYEIKGIPYKYIVSGPVFEEKYKEVRKRNPKSDLAGVWIIPPQEIKEETYAVRLQQEIDTYPIVGHMDRDLKKK
jgi:hypothetical protein